MKKKLLTTITSGLLAMALLGCSLSDIRNQGQIVDDPDVSDIPIIVINNNDATNSEAGSGQDTPDTVNSPTEVIDYDGAYAVFYEEYDTIYIIDSYDRVITSYNRKNFENNTNLQGDNLAAASFVGYDDGIYYFLHDNAFDSDVYTTLFAVDAATDEAAVVCHYAQDETVSAVDIYDGKIYVTFYSAGSRENKYYEDVYTKKQDSFEYEVEEGNQNTFLSKNKVDRIYTNSTNSAFHKYCNASVERSVAEYGFVIAESAGKYERLNSGGSIQVFDIPYNGITVWGYDSRYVTLTAYNEEYYGRYIYCYDMDNDAYYTVGNGDATFLGYADGYLYYAEEEGEEYGRPNYHVYMFDPTNGTTQEKYDLYNTPGVGKINAGVTGFCYIKDHVLFLQCVSGNIGWMAVYYDEAGATYKNLGCIIETVNAMQYGSIMYDTTGINCPFCMTRLMNYYAEVYQVDEGSVAGGAAINEYLRNLDSNYYDKYVGDLYEVEDASLCDGHVNMGMSNFYQVNVTDANILSDKYLTVNYEADGYLGGAHGSYNTVQYVFDIETGERLTIADLYQGTEAEFREIIATKTKDDYLDDPYRYYTTGLGAQGVYDTAYEAASFNDVDLEFYEDKVILVYQEYEMGPYAAGQIRIEMTYRELFGRNRL